MIKKIIIIFIIYFQNNILFCNKVFSILNCLKQSFSCFKVENDLNVIIEGDYIIFENSLLQKINEEQEEENIEEVIEKKIFKLESLNNFNLKYLILIDINDKETKNNLLSNSQFQDISKKMYLKKFKEESFYNFSNRIKNSFKKNKYRLLKFEKEILNFFFQEFKRKSNLNRFNILEVIKFNKNKKQFKLSNNNIEFNLNINDIITQKKIDHPLGIGASELEVNIKLDNTTINKNNCIFLLKINNQENKKNIKLNSSEDLFIFK